MVSRVQHTLYEERTLFSLEKRDNVATLLPSATIQREDVEEMEPDAFWRGTQTGQEATNTCWSVGNSH